MLLASALAPLSMAPARALARGSAQESEPAAATSGAGAPPFQPAPDYVLNVDTRELDLFGTPTRGIAGQRFDSRNRDSLHRGGPLPSAGQQPVAGTLHPPLARPDRSQLHGRGPEDHPVRDRSHQLDPHGVPDPAVRQLLVPLPLRVAGTAGTQRSVHHRGASSRTRLRPRRDGLPSGLAAAVTRGDHPADSRGAAGNPGGEDPGPGRCALPRQAALQHRSGLPRLPHEWCDRSLALDDAGAQGRSPSSATDQRLDGDVLPRGTRGPRPRDHRRRRSAGGAGHRRQRGDRGRGTLRRSGHDQEDRFLRSACGRSRHQARGQWRAAHLRCPGHSQTRSICLPRSGRGQRGLPVTQVPVPDDASRRSGPHLRNRPRWRDEEVPLVDGGGVLPRALRSGGGCGNARDSFR